MTPATVWPHHLGAAPGGCPGFQRPHPPAAFFRCRFSGCLGCPHLTFVLSCPCTLSVLCWGGGRAGWGQRQALRLQILRPPDLGKSFSLAGLQCCPQDMGQELGNGEEREPGGVRSGPGPHAGADLAPRDNGPGDREGRVQPAMGRVPVTPCIRSRAEPCSPYSGGLPEEGVSRLALEVSKQLLSGIC